VALALALVLLLAVPASAEARLVFERPDGSQIRFGAKPRAWCGKWEPDVPVPSLHVGLPRGPLSWQLSAVRRDIEIGRRIRFPNIFIWNRPHDARLFASHDGNEASTNEEEASGSMTFTRATCRRRGRVAFRIRAVLGSEFIDREPVRVTGSWRGRISRRP
jgi:hypothetical protein